MIEDAGEALFRLLHHRSFRVAYLAGAPLDLAPEVRAQLATIDVDEMQRTSRQIARNLLVGNHDASGGLRQAYPRTLQAVETTGVDQFGLIEDFMESPAFETYREVPFTGPGVCVEEAFFAYMRGRIDVLGEVAGAVNVLIHEFLTAMMSILVINPRPAFRTVSPLLRANGQCHYASWQHPAAVLPLLGYAAVDAPADARVLTLYAAAPQRLVAGPVPPLVLEVVARGSRAAALADAAALAAAHDTTTIEVASVADRLAAMGLVA